MRRPVIAILLWFTGCLVLYAANLPHLIERSEPKVVKVGIVGDKGGGVCSGAFISEDGKVLTCAHCFERKDTRKVFIKLSNGHAYPASLLKLDVKHDLALISPIVIEEFPYFDLGTEPIKGQEVVAFGSPLGIQNTATVGWVVNVHPGGTPVIFHSAFINPGNSGGPLVDSHGRLIGINEAMLQINMFTLAQGLYIAIDLSTIHTFMEDSTDE